MRLLIVALIILGWAAVPARAADAPAFAPAPAWVVPVEAPAAQTAATRGGGAALRLLDLQWRYDDEGEHGFTRTLVRVASPDALEQLGNYTLSWHPGTQSVTVHKVAIHRDGATIDVLGDGSGFTILRREAGLERSMLDGVLAANLQISDLRVGDTLEAAYTVTELNPVLGGRAQSMMPVVAPFAADRFHFVASWPSDFGMRWRAGDAFPRVRESRRNGITTVRADESAFAAPAYPDGAPGRFVDTFSFQLSSFESWESISARFAEPYAAAARFADDSPLAGEVARIAAASDDPVGRTEAVLALVQGDVRYVFDGTGLGGYMPATADQVWASRYGDCKGKTVLLVALLRALGIEADPALVSASRGDGIDAALPMPGRFDHAIARVRIGDRTYWLDGTRRGDSRLARIAVPPMHWALPLTSPGSGLERLELAGAELPTVEQRLVYDVREGVTLPAKGRAELVFRGEEAIGLRRTLELLSVSDRERFLREYWAQSYSYFTVETSAHAFDDETGEVRLTMTGPADLSWDVGGSAATRRMELSRARLGRNLAPRRQPGPYAEAPVALAAQHFLTRYLILLPSDGRDFLIEGEPIDQRIGPAHYRRTARIAGERIEVEASTRIEPGEIPHAQAVADDRASDDVFARRLFVRAPYSYQLTEREQSVAAREGRQAPAAGTTPEVMRGVMAAIQSGDLEGALAQVNRAIERDGRTAGLLAMRAGLQAGLGRTERADADLDAALALEPTHGPALLMRANRLIEAGRGEDAAILLDRLILTDPRNPHAYLMRSELRVDAGRFDAALADLDILLQLQPENRAGWATRARIHVDRGDYDQAMQAAEELLRAFPDDATALALHGNVLVLLGRREEAAAELARSIEAEETADVYLARAVFNLSGSPERRLEDVLSVIRLEPDRRLSFSLLRAVLEAEGAYERLEDAYRIHGARMAPDSRREQRAIMAAAAGRDEDYIALLDERVAAQPRSAKALYERCWFRSTRGVELERALADCDAAVALIPSVAYFDARALVRLRRGELDQAIADYDRAIAIQPRRAHALYGRGIARIRRGDAGGAADLAAARQLTPEIDADFRRHGIEP